METIFLMIIGAGIGIPVFAMIQLQIEDNKIKEEIRDEQIDRKIVRAIRRAIRMNEIKRR